MESWGRFPKAGPQTLLPVAWTNDPFPPVDAPILPRGLGRSYGDSCLNDNGVLLTTSGLDHFLSFDSEAGLLRCEAGTTFQSILDFIVPRGWFLPVVPGTRFITVGGAIANDIHGKNHHRAGTFGRHVLQLELLRSDGSRMVCSPDANPDFFKATIGGLGLTGLILWAEIKLVRIDNGFIDQEVIKFPDLETFFQLSEESDATHDYTVAWIDCMASGASLGRGHFIRGRHSTNKNLPLTPPSSRIPWVVPIDFPDFVLSSSAVRGFNSFYYHRQLRNRRQGPVPLQPFFFPLDSIRQWNRIYGHRGFLQYQCLVPPHDAFHFTRKILEEIAAARQGSFLAVLKKFGNFEPYGVMSFPRPGITLSLDFPYTGRNLLDLLDRLDLRVAEAGGSVYPAKDARLSSKMFKSFFPRWSEFKKWMDPKFSSSFWRRVE